MHRPDCATHNTTLPSIYCPAYTAHNSLSSLQCPACSTHHSLTRMHRPACSVQHALTSIRWPECTAQDAQTSMRSPALSDQYALLRMHKPAWQNPLSSMHSLSWPACYATATFTVVKFFIRSILVGQSGRRFCLISIKQNVLESCGKSYC